MLQPENPWFVVNLWEMVVRHFLKTCRNCEQNVLHRTQNPDQRSRLQNDPQKSGPKISWSNLLLYSWSCALDWDDFRLYVTRSYFIHGLCLLLLCFVSMHFECTMMFETFSTAAEHGEFHKSPLPFICVKSREIAVCWTPHHLLSFIKYYQI